MNRTIRGTRNPWVVLRQSKIHGRGVYARTNIPKGTRLIEYAGELITHAEADRRYDDEDTSDHHTFLFILNEKWCVDAVRGGNIARFINHSCDPNCIAWIIDDKIWIDALRPIRKGEELGYEYEYEFEKGYTIEDLEAYPCFCGSPKCRGTIVDVPKSKRHMLRELKRRRLARERAARRPKHARKLR